jgi:hypothetical protein
MMGEVRSTIDHRPSSIVLILMKRNLLIVALVLIAVGLGIGAIAYVEDVHADRTSTLRISGPVRVYDRESPAGYDRGDDGVIFILRPDDSVQVLRIHRATGVEAIRVRLHDGREGYIFCCDNFEISR